MSFLAILERKVIDVPASPAVEGKDAVLDEDGNEIEPAVEAQREVKEESHLEIGKAFVELSEAQVAANVGSNANPQLSYYKVKMNPQSGTVTLHKVREKAGPRQTAPVREIVEVEADGDVIGSAEIDA